MSKFSRFLAILAAIAATAPALRAQADEVVSRPIVVELFTSQGCSSCPPADALLGRLSQGKDVVALTLPITYWDMLGWKDTFATDANTQRQKAYAKAMNRLGIYTPQIIVDGQLDVVGNQRSRVMMAVDTRAQHRSNMEPPSLSLAVGSGHVEISIAAAATNAKTKPIATIWVMHTLSQGAVDVQQGENRNHRLAYANLVRDLERVGEWTGDEMKIEVPATTVGHAKQDGVAVILQNHDHGEVMAAALTAVPSNHLLAAPR
jgi:hypothetical protein